MTLGTILTVACRLCVLSLKDTRPNQDSPDAGSALGRIETASCADVCTQRLFSSEIHMLSDYTRTFDKDILPLLRRQKGFKDEITFSSPGGTEVTAISLWDNKANAEAYNTNAYPEVLKTLARVTDGTPQVQTGEVVNSTFHKIAEHTTRLRAYELYAQRGMAEGHAVQDWLAAEAELQYGHSTTARRLGPEIKSADVN